MSNRRGKSDCCVVPKKLPNKAAGEAPATAEVVEGRRQAKGNAIAARMSRRSMRTYDMGNALDGNAIYEQDFLGFSYGFRPGRSAHNALEVVAMGVSARKVNWILDADVSKFFDTIEHDWLVKFIEHRVADARVVRLIKKWLHAGVLEDGRLTQSELGTVQGGSITS